MTEAELLAKIADVALGWEEFRHTLDDGEAALSRLVASLGLAPGLRPDLAELIARLRAMHSHRGDGAPTQFVNPDGPDAAAAIEDLVARVGRLPPSQDVSAAVAAEREAIDRAVEHLMATRRVGKASINSEQRAADDSTMRAAYLDIITIAAPFLATIHTRSATPDASSEGMVLVPREPTKVMRRAGGLAINQDEDALAVTAQEAAAAFRAMLAASEQGERDNG